MTTPRPARERRVYARAPIVEAVIDIRCVNPSTLSFRDLVEFSRSLSPAYEQHGEAMQITEVRTADGKQQRTEEKVGVAVRSADGRYVVQLQLEGFACSRLAPYQKWEPFRDEASRLWALYRAATQPAVVRRLGIRYVNRLEIGTPTIDRLNPYLQLYPVTPWELTSPPAAFFLQIQQPKERGRMLVVNQGTVQHAQTGQAAIVLDLDAFLEEEMAVEDVKIWNVVEELHVLDEDAFEASITDKTRELIE